MNVDALLQPLAGDSPCGTNLEDTQLLASFDSFRLFGRSTPIAEDVDWPAVRSRALEALGQSKDLRPLTHLAAAAIRSEGIAGYTQLLQVAAQWLKTWWKEVYPLVDDDAILRRNSLNGFADAMAVLDALRRTPLVANRQLGSVNFRQTEIAAGRLTAADGEPAGLSEDQIRAVMTAAPAEELLGLDATLAAGIAAGKEISETMSSEGGGTEAIPDFAPLLAILTRTRLTIKPYLLVEASEGAGGAGVGAANDATGPAGGPAGGLAGGTGAGSVPGAIRSREDAIRALDAVVAFFRSNEPSSPVPMLVERARRLVARDFLDVLAELLPDAVQEAKRAGGIKDES